MKESKTRERSSRIHTVSLEVKIEKKKALKVKQDSNKVGATVVPDLTIVSIGDLRMNLLKRERMT
jgi:glyoxylate carboligase